RGDLEDAERLLRRSLQLRPNWADAQINLANVALAQRRFEEATTLFSSALQAEPGYVHVYESFARAASRAGRLDEAAAALRRLRAFTPKTLFHGTCLPPASRILIVRGRRWPTSANCSITTPRISTSPLLVCNIGLPSYPPNPSRNRWPRLQTSRSPILFAKRVYADNC